jgi:hypothetical protein
MIFRQKPCKAAQAAARSRELCVYTLGVRRRAKRLNLRQLRANDTHF